MKPITFEEANKQYAGNQDEYLTLPAHVAPNDPYGVVTTCWKLTLKERLRVLFTGQVWFQQLTFNAPLQPQKPSAEKPEEVTSHADS